MTTPASPPDALQEPPYGSSTGPVRILMLYLGLVVLPVSLAIWTAAYLHRIELRDVWFQADARMGRTTLALVERQMSLEFPLLLDQVVPLMAPDSSIPGVRAAQRGDTVLALEAGARDLEAVLYLPVGRGRIRTSRAGVGTPALQVLEGNAGYEGAVYLGGVRRAASDPDFGPESLDPAVARRLQVLVDGIPYVMEDGRNAALVPRPTTRPDNGSLIALAAPSQARRKPLLHRFGSIAVLLAVFLAVARLATLRGPLSPHSPWLRNLVERGLAVIPLLLAMGALVNVTGRFRQDVADYTLDTLRREMAVARALGPDASTDEVRDVTGYQTTRILDGRIQSSTLPGGVFRVALTEVPPPDRGRTVAGRLETDVGPLAYVSHRNPDGSSLLLSFAGDTSVLQNFTLRMGGLGLVLLMLLLLYPAGYEPTDDPETEESA